MPVKKKGSVRILEVAQFGSYGIMLFTCVAAALSLFVLSEGATLRLDVRTDVLVRLLPQLREFLSGDHLKLGVQNVAFRKSVCEREHAQYLGVKSAILFNCLLIIGTKLLFTETISIAIFLNA